MTEMIRLTVDVPVSLMHDLKCRAEEQNVTMSAALQRALSVDIELAKYRREGAKVLLDRAGDLTELVFKPEQCLRNSVD